MIILVHKKYYRELRNFAYTFKYNEKEYFVFQYWDIIRFAKNENFFIKVIKDN